MQLNHTGWFYSKQDKALYRHNETGWQQHGQTPSRTRTKQFHTSGLPTAKLAENHLQAASILHQVMYYILTGAAEMEQPRQRRSGKINYNKVQLDRNGTCKLLLQGWWTKYVRISECIEQ